MRTSGWKSTHRVPLLRHHASEIWLRIVHIWVFLISVRFWSCSSSISHGDLKRIGMRRIFEFYNTWLLGKVNGDFLLIFIFTYSWVYVCFLVFGHSRRRLVYLIYIHTRVISNFHSRLFLSLSIEQINRSFLPKMIPPHLFLKVLFVCLFLALAKVAVEDPDHDPEGAAWVLVVVHETIPLHLFLRR